MRKIGLSNTDSIPTNKILPVDKSKLLKKLDDEPLLWNQLVRLEKKLLIAKKAGNRSDEIERCYYSINFTLRSKGVVAE